MIHMQHCTSNHHIICHLWSYKEKSSALVYFVNMWTFITTVAFSVMQTCIYYVLEDKFTEMWWQTKPKMDQHHPGSHQALHSITQPPKLQPCSTRPSTQNSTKTRIFSGGEKNFYCLSEQPISFLSLKRLTYITKTYYSTRMFTHMKALDKSIYEMQKM